MLADRVRAYLAEATALPVEEKKMFNSLAFLVDGKMCVNVNGDGLMCRFDPKLMEELAEMEGFTAMVMKGKVYKGYGYVEVEALRSDKQLRFWVDLCLAYNPRAKSSKKG